MELYLASSTTEPIYAERTVMTRNLRQIAWKERPVMKTTTGRYYEWYLGPIHLEAPEWDSEVDKIVR